MSYIYKNISGNTAKTLVSLNEIPYNKSLKTINICNTHSSAACDVDLYLYNHIPDVVEPNTYDVAYSKTDITYYIIKKYEIAANSYLHLESSMLTYDHDVFFLKIKLGDSGSTVDVIMNIQ